MTPDPSTVDNPPPAHAVEPISPDLDPVIAEIAAHHATLTPLQRIGVATAMEMLSTAARYAAQARHAGGYATTDRGALAVHPGQRHAAELQREAMRILTAILATDPHAGSASAAARAMNAVRWGNR
jgi:D-serine deaminase-like pyridoxal phosphate-dependent protein